ncbi:protein YebF [Rahnella selenatireducens]|uniref:protein YebF n=1 Tax=Rahnella selenatireducens TaxID=3389797 RepID=UPI00396976BE
MKKIILSAVMAVAGMSGLVQTAQADEPEVRTATVTPCANATKDELAALVKRDFLQNRIPRWDTDKKALGTSTPVAWVDAGSISGDNKKWDIPLKVRGDHADKTYDVTLNCQLGEISYSTPA